jgi:hypothetical protein
MIFLTKVWRPSKELLIMEVVMILSLRKNSIVKCLKLRVMLNLVLNVMKKIKKNMEIRSMLRKG